MNRLDLDYNNTNLKERRRFLRKNMTKAEVLLWNHIRNKQIAGIKFRRQFSIGNSVVDFYAPKIRLAIEVDGLTHVTEEEIEYDSGRQQKIEEMGISFLRFKNEEIYGNINLVIESITAKVKELNLVSHPLCISPC